MAEQPGAPRIASNAGNPEGSEETSPLEPSEGARPGCHLEFRLLDPETA